MSSMTAVEFVKRTRDQLIAGIVEDIYTTNPLYNFIPWIGYVGSGISVNREDTLGDAQFLALGGTITAKAPSVVDQVLFNSTTIIGDAEINGLQAVESASDINDTVAIEISSKAKSVGRLIQQGMATGDGSLPNMNSMHSLIDSTQYTPSNGVGGAVITLEMLDTLGALIKSKDGIVDWYQMPTKILLKIRSLLRAAGGTQMIQIQMGDKQFQIDSWNGVPMFANDWLSVAETDDGAALTGGSQSSVYAGVWDDGSKIVGSALIYPEASELGVIYEPVGATEAKDETIHRVKSYTNFANFNKRGIGRLTGVKTA